MSLELPQYYETEFAKNWDMRVQQTDSRLAASVTSTAFQGKRKWFNQLDVGSMTEVTERKGDTPDGDSTGNKYWIYRRKFEFVRTWDEDDAMQLGSIALPDSDEVASASAAENRTKDDVIIAAFDATRYIGEEGTTTDAFPAGQSIAVNYVKAGSPANSGLTIGKLREAARILNENEVEDGERYIAYAATQLDDMLGTVEATSRDYSDLMSLKDGKISKFMGFTWIPSQRLPINTGTDVRSIFAWHKTGVHFAYAGRNVHMDVLPSRRHCKQLRIVSRMGAVRRENEKVVRIYADESP